MLREVDVGLPGRDAHLAIRSEGPGLKMRFRAIIEPWLPFHGKDLTYRRGPQWLCLCVEVPDHFLL